MPLIKGPAIPVDKPKYGNNDGNVKEPTVTTIDDDAAVQPPQKQPRQTLRFDPEYARWREPFGDKTRVPACATPLALRRYNDTFIRFIYAQLPTQPHIQRTRYTCRSYDGVEIGIERFATAEQTSTNPQQQLKPAVLHIHGGGMVAGDVDIFAPHIARLAAESGVQIFSVEYRLAPEHPAPTPAEDCYAALAWLSSHAAALGVDASRLGLMGESAGGGLAAGTALAARDRGLEPPVKKQVLVYPMLDDRTVTTLSRDGTPLERFATFSLPLAAMCWRAYVGRDKAGRADADVSPYAAPARADDLRGLPSTYIDVGGLDMFRNECTAFAARLAAADVEVEFQLFPGVPHAFEAASDIGITKRAIEGRMRWLKDL
ncbi:hypothetical protein F4677DRAFT_443918 [Hypoxylon crocopeplum]|nr:hypothetical protein F4677DRAFT_443918 [Hypoxylon crocopeplum]